MFNTSYTFDDIQILPWHSEIRSRMDVDISTRISKNIRVDKPFISSPMDTVTDGNMARAMRQCGAIGAIHRFNTIAHQLEEIEATNDMMCIASVGVVGDYKERVQEITSKFSNVVGILVDVAHGDTDLMQEAITWLKSNVPSRVDIIAGNVATYYGAKNLAMWGADGIRVGIGSGAICTTRINTGVGVPQVTAILECVRGVRDSGIDVPIIADGGIRNSGDVAKALSLGAESVMLGSLLAGTVESAAEYSSDNTKRYRGAASFETKMAHGQSLRNVEGVSSDIPCVGTVQEVIDGLSDGLRSAMSYVNARTIEEFYENAEHILVTQSGIVEASAHIYGR